MEKMMHAGIRYLLIAVLVYAGYCGLLFLLQRQIMFPRYMIPTPSTVAHNIAGLQKIWLATKFGKVESWLLSPESASPSQPAPAVVFAHGNGELIDYWPQEMKPFTRMGVAVLLVEYPGYGRSAGSPNQESITEAFLSAYDLLTVRQDIDRSRIVLLGRSLGGGAVCALAAARPTKALILMSTFTNVRSFAVRYLVPKFMVRDPFDNLAVITSYDGPILIIHGKHDTIIPFSHGKKLHDAAPKSKFIAYDAGHNDCPPDWPVFWNDVESFLRDARVIQD
jgi:fermentation-respiration switch protein FrsA (DUF1100 family)